MEYRELIDRLLAEGRTTGNDHSEEMIESTRMNVHRMHRVEKTAVLPDELVRLLLSVETKMTWVLLTEAWNSDAAQNVPAIVKMADASPLIEVKILLHEENPEILDALPANASRFIPQLIALDSETLEVLGNWGPRPVPAEQLVQEGSANKKLADETAAKLELWYAQDNSQTIQQEFIPLLQDWSELTAPQDQVMARCS